MTSSGKDLDWNQLKPRILWDLANGKTQQQIRQGLAEDPFRVSVSKSQLETQLKHWKYRNSLHEQEWKVVSHRISKRRKIGKATSQVLVNGFVLNERKVAKAISRYDTPTLIYRLPSPQIPQELSHHLIEIRTPPPSHRSLQLPHFQGGIAQTGRESLTLYLTSAERVWPRTAQWRKVELSIGQFVARFFLPTYGQDERFRDAFNTFERGLPVSRTDRGRNMPASGAGHDKPLQAQGCGTSTDPHGDAPVHRYEIQRSSCGSDIHTAIVKTLVGLLYGLSNQSLDDTGRRALASIMEAPAWNTVLPHLRDVLTVIDPRIVQAITEGLLKESIHTCNHNMLDLSLGLGADPTQRIRSYDIYEKCHVLSTPLAAVCDRYSEWGPRLEKPVLSLLKSDPYVSNSALLRIINANCLTIAEDTIRSQPARIIDFTISVSDLGGRIRSKLRDFGMVTPLLVACSDGRHSAERLSLIRCLLERNAKADLKSMIAAAQAGDGGVISLLHQHGAPVNGFIPNLGSPLSHACKAALRPERVFGRYSSTIGLLLGLGASVNDVKTQDLKSFGVSPLHILALADDPPVLIEALDMLLEHGFDINHRATLDRYDYFIGNSAINGPANSKLAETPLEHAIVHSRWSSAMRFLSANCELTGRELILINSIVRSGGELSDETYETVFERFRRFISSLLAKAPHQAAALDWDGLSVLQRAIQREQEDLILALFESGVKPTPTDFRYMLCNWTKYRIAVCELPSNIQMELIQAAELSTAATTNVSTVRLILAFACPGVVRHILNCFPDFYDSEGICYLIARLISRDVLCYTFIVFCGNWDEDEPEDTLTMDDLVAFVSRRTISNRHEDWESTAVTIAARAGRPDIIRILTESGQFDLRGSGLIPALLLKEALVCDPKTFFPSNTAELETAELNCGRLGVWIKCCRMDDPNMRCSPLTAAAMVVPTTASEEVFDQLLALNYQPDGWTVLIASCQGRLSILQRLNHLDCWPDILDHEDRPDWCPTALQIAVHNNHASTVRFLLGTRTMIDAIDLSPRRPFCFAPMGTVDADSPTILPRTALQHAVEKENMGLVTILINAGADVNAAAAMDSGATALQIASIQGSIPMMEYLIGQGADPYASGAAKHGRTALQGAGEHGRKDAVELLLAQDASKACWYRNQLIEAVCYAENNAHHVVAGILRASVFPQWTLEDEKALEMLSEDWEGSSQHSVLYESIKEVDALQETFQNMSHYFQAPHDSDASSDVRNEGLNTEDLIFFQEDDSWFLQEPHESDANSHVRNEGLNVEDLIFFQEDDSWFRQEMELGIEGYGELDVRQIDESDLYDGVVTSGLTFQ